MPVKEASSEETRSEGFLVLSGGCTLIVEEEERPLRQWDGVHCPAGTRHVFVGGEGPCASAAKDTGEPDEAYADWPGEHVPVRIPWPVAAGVGT